MMVLEEKLSEHKSFNKSSWEKFERLKFCDSPIYKLFGQLIKKQRFNLKKNPLWKR